MGNYILALNCGSSSLKFNLFLLKENNKLLPFIQGVVEEIGNTERSRLKYNYKQDKQIINHSIKTHRDALIKIFDAFHTLNVSKDEIKAVGHRVVHGGDKYSKSVRIDNDVIQAIEDLIPIAPLHNPPNLNGIKETMKLLPDVPQVAIFDTAFHGTIPEYAYRYAIPEEWYKDFGVRRYGFHGTSHMYVAKRAAKFLEIPYHQFNGITAHLGNGCSISKIANGKCMDTSMGFTPLEGLIMGTRSGDIDPALIAHVAKSIKEKQNLDEAQAFKMVTRALNKESGLKALAKTNMMQDIRKKAIEGDVQAELVIAIYAYRIAKYIGAYWATLDTCDALIFTAGLGENEGYVRKKILQFLKNLKIKINEEANAIRKQETQIGISKALGLHALVIPTDEESVIGYDTLYLGYLKQSLPHVYPFEQ